ncbi:amidase [Streptomyces sp. NRRL F-4489]|uniref:amidase n=1 Tax=Streptomyces sp. NRRL F-4489 TaxID=1609095 RepID=UPI00074790FA|nr:amidase [Streptomyces sp. NRRL F-4489]KUL38590.1 amidase [Streptomyces sp. NRRL F-4489]
MTTLLGSRSLVQEAAALRSGADDPLTAVLRTCDRIDAVDHRIHAFVPEPGRRDRLREAARELAAAGPPGPAGRPALYGVPVGVKDIVHVNGLPTRAGSALPPEELAGPQAAVVDRLRTAGALIAGKTVTAEFAVTAPGPTRNPHHTGHTPGGSSSGSAAAVAAGMVPLAIGTQTVGSMIRPAAYCGVVGFKPTFGRIPCDGVLPNAVSFDTLGCYAVDVAGVALAASVLCDDWRTHEDSGTGDAGGTGYAGAPARLPVLGVPVGPYLGRAGDEARHAFGKQRAVLAAAGYEVREVPVMADFDRITEQLFTMNRYEVARAHARWFARHADRYREQTAAAIREGHTIGDAAYEAARERRAAFRERLAADGAAAGIDLWIAPAATGPAPEGLATTGNSVMCLPWSNAGLPSLTLPAGRSAGGLPLGLQLVGGAGADEELLAWAAGIERVAAGLAPRALSG